MSGLRVEELPAACCFAELGRQWDDLAVGAGTPYLSTAWLAAWTQVFAPRARCVLCLGQQGELLGGACVAPRPVAGLGGCANVETGEWTVCGRDPAARRLVWDALAERGALHVVLPALPDGGQDARAAFRAAGYLVTSRVSWDSPRLALPSSAQDLLAGTSRNLRAQYRRRSKALQQLGQLELRTGSSAEDLEQFLALEAAGWKHRGGTSITSRGTTARLYRGFADGAARDGWLRLQFLEVGGRTVAADLSCAYAGGVFMLKTAYDEQLAALSPGLVLRGRALEAAAAEGFAFYDFLGAAEPYKVRWGATPRPHTTLHAHRPPLGALPHAYHALVRPRLKQLRDRVRHQQSIRPAAVADGAR
jgi:CelD/BcsL family acetyltransferase involved in cellulose biosynthesis